MLSPLLSSLVLAQALVGNVQLSVTEPGVASARVDSEAHPVSAAASTVERIVIETAPTRVETFLISRAQSAPVEAVAHAGSRDPMGKGAIPGQVPATELAVVRLLRLDGGDYTLLEREIIFREEGWRLHQVERIEGSKRRLTWREIGPGGRRTWGANWDLDGDHAGVQAKIVSYGWRRPVHTKLSGGAPLMGALEWLENRRAGGCAPAVDLLDPLRHGARPLDSRVIAFEERATLLAGLGLTGEQAAEALVVEAGDSTLVLHGSSLVAFSLAGGWARPISELEYERRAARWGFRPGGRHPAVEAAMHRDETLRTLGRLLEAGVPVNWR